MATREELTERILDHKRSLDLTWKGIAAELGSGSPILYTAALLGQMRLTREEAEKAVELLELEQADIPLLVESPERGAQSRMPPTDPLIYRFYELLQNYGSTWKALIEEEFGDGIMSAIDFRMTLDREPDPAGDRVKITMSGKFLPFKRY